MKLIILSIFLMSSVQLVHCMEDEEADEFLQLSKDKLLETMEVEFVTAKFVLQQLNASMESLKLTNASIPNNPASIPPALFLKHADRVNKARKIIEVAWATFLKDSSPETNLNSLEGKKAGS